MDKIQRISRDKTQRLIRPWIKTYQQNNSQTSTLSKLCPWAEFQSNSKFQLAEDKLVKNIMGRSITMLRRPRRGLSLLIRCRIQIWRLQGRTIICRKHTDTNRVSIDLNFRLTFSVKGPLIIVEPTPTTMISQTRVWMQEETTHFKSTILQLFLLLIKTLRRLWT